jgi:hypothetical protein
MMVTPTIGRLIGLGVHREGTADSRENLPLTVGMKVNYDSSRDLNAISPFHYPHVSWLDLEFGYFNIDMPKAEIG